MNQDVEDLVKRALEQFSARQPSRRLILRDSHLPYLYRTYLEGNETPKDASGLFLHKFVASDEPDKLHNHPWSWSTSYILAGSYREIRATHQGDPEFPTRSNMASLNPTTMKNFKPGDINQIDRHDFHRVEIMDSEVWTLFLHGPRVGDWGFVTEKEGVQIIKVVPYRTRSTPNIQGQR